MRLVAALAALALGLPAVAAAQEPQTSLPDIEDEVMCPICGVTLKLATEGPAGDPGARVHPRADRRGETKEQIKDALVAEFCLRCSPSPRPRASIWPRGSCPAP